MHFGQIKRREFITLLSGAAAWPLAARAQQPGTAVIGYLDTEMLRNATGDRRGDSSRLDGSGYVEGHNLNVVYRWAENCLERLAGLAADLVGRQVAVIVAVPDASALAAKEATKSTPIVFLVGANPVDTGIVTTLNRPGGNLTGIYSLSIEMAAKRLELLHELLPAATSMAYLVNPANEVVADTETREMQVAARNRGVRLVTVHARNVSEFEAAFANLVGERAAGLVVGTDISFLSHPGRACRTRGSPSGPNDIPGARGRGGLRVLSYGTDLLDARRQVGLYTGRILKGENAANLPVQQVTKTQLVFNLKTAKALGLNVPPSLLARADEVIE